MYNVEAVLKNEGKVKFCWEEDWGLFLLFVSRCLVMTGSLSLEMRSSTYFTFLPLLTLVSLLICEASTVVIKSDLYNQTVKSFFFFFSFFFFYTGDIENTTRGDD